MRIFGFEIRKTVPSTVVSPRRGGWWPFVQEPYPGAWQRNDEIDNRETVLSNSAVFSCASIIATDVAKLRVKLMTDDGAGIWSEVRNSPYLAVLRRPNRYSTRFQFFESWMLSKMLTGNAYAIKERDARGLVQNLYLLDPKRVTVLVAADGGVYYQLGLDELHGTIGKDSITVPASEIIHDRMNCLFHPLVGVSPLYACFSAATMGNRIQTNSRSFFSNMSRPSGVLTAPDEISDSTAKELKEYWHSNYTGGASGRVAVLGDGLKFEPMTVAAADAQLIEQLRWTVEDVARAFGVPLHKLNAGAMPTSNNVEALDQQYYSRTLQGLMEAAELCLDEGLGLPSFYRTEFDLRGLLRMDTAGRYEALSKAVGAGWMSPNEARASEDLPPVAGGNSPYLQQQNWSLEALAARDDADLTGGDEKAAVRRSKRLHAQDVQVITKMLADGRFRRPEI